MRMTQCSASSNALRCASTALSRGLRALTTPARGTDWQLRDGGRSDEDHNDVDDHVDRAYGGLITQCRTALLRFATTASGARIRSTLSGHGSSASFTTSQFGVSGLWRYRVLRTTRRYEAAFTMARSCHGLTERSIDGRITNATVAARSTALADRCWHSARIRAHQHRRVDRHIDAPERATHQSRIACEWGTPWIPAPA